MMSRKRSRLIPHPLYRIRTVIRKFRKIDARPRCRRKPEFGQKTLVGVEIFVKSRQKINKPTGEQWFDDRLNEIKEALKVEGE